ncbi:MAG: hypothetical protein H6581_04500 [Bacteroidia bacterium]|nr:hypothetical protein [Bacteroidia bacterium]
MKKSNLFYLGILLLLVYCTPAAQTDPQKALAQAEEAWKNTSGYHATLEVLMAGASVPATGQFFADKGRYHMDFDEDETVCDLKYTMHWYKAFASAKYEPYDPVHDLSLGGMYALYKYNHTLKFDLEENGMRKFTLMDQDGSSHFPKKEIWLSNKTNLIEKMVLYSGQFGSYTYTVKDVHEGESLDERLFTPSESFYGRVLAGEVPAQEHDHAAHEGHDHDHDHDLKHYFDF